MEETYGLKLKQIKDIKRRIDENAIAKGEGAPWFTTEGNVGQIYLDTFTNEQWILGSVDDTEGWTRYNWSHLNTGLSVDEIWPGYIEAYKTWSVAYTEEYAMECTIVSIDTAKLEEFLAAHPSEMGMPGINFNYEMDSWIYEGDWTMIPDGEMEATTGIKVTRESDWAMFSVQSSVTVDTSSGVEQLFIPTLEYLSALCFQEGEGSISPKRCQRRIYDAGGTPTGVEYVQVPAKAINTASFGCGNSGKLETELPDYFLAYCGNLNRASLYPRIIGNYVLAYCRALNISNFSLQVEKIGDGFMSQCTNYNQAVSSPVKEVGDNFLYGCTLLQDTVHLPEVEKIGNGFLAGCTQVATAYNTYISIPKAREIGQEFLSGCASFNRPLTFHPAATIGSSAFMLGCTSFAQDLKLPTLAISQYATNFMYNCKAMGGHTVDLGENDATAVASMSSSVKQNWFATNDSSAASYTQGITIKGKYADDWATALPDRSSSPYRKLISLGNETATNLSDAQFNSLWTKLTPVEKPFMAKLLLGAKGTYIVNDTDAWLKGLYWPLSGTSSHTLSDGTVIQNTDITGIILGEGCPTDWSAGPSSGQEFFCVNLPNLVSFDDSLARNRVTAIGNLFFRGTTFPAGSVSYPNLTRVGLQFFGWNPTFNAPINLPNLTYADMGFLENATSFNSTINFPKLKTMGDNFLANASSFNQNLTLPSTITNLGAYMLSGAHAMTGTITCNCPATVTPENDYTLAADEVSAAQFTTGITLVGPYASDWKTKFPDRASTSYRKLILG